MAPTIVDDIVVIISPAEGKKDRVRPCTHVYPCPDLVGLVVETLLKTKVMFF